jgi:hypothetical protein
MLFVALFCQSSMDFGQSTTAATGNSQMPNELTMVQGPFDFSSGLPGQRAVTPTFRSFSCNAPKTAKAQANAPIDLDNLFNQSCADLKSHVDLFARNEVSFLRIPVAPAVRPQAKGEPIPTQWPNARVEQIPTQWQNLKLQPILGLPQSSVPLNRNSR